MAVEKPKEKNICALSSSFPLLCISYHVRLGWEGGSHPISIVSPVGHHYLMAIKVKWGRRNRDAHKNIANTVLRQIVA